MADKSRIEWTDATWNPITGCTRVSKGCEHCYAERLAATRMKHHPSRVGLTDEHGRWNGQVRINEEWLDQPLCWKKPRRIFVCAHSDLFHEAVPSEWIARVFAVMLGCPQHVFQILTKRPGRMLRYLTGPRSIGILPNVWLGVSAENQDTLNERVWELMATPAAVRFVSLEPLLEEVTVFSIDGPVDQQDTKDPAIHWVIGGGESGPGARPMHPQWVRSIRGQCEMVGCPFFFKQWGEWIEIDGPRCRAIRQDRTAADAWLDNHGKLHPYNRHTNHRFSVYDTSIVRRVGKKRAGRLLDGRTWDEMPEVAHG